MNKIEYCFKVYLLMVMLSITAIHVVSAASFDCGSARQGVDKIVCSDPVLSVLDEKVSQEYSQGLKILTPFWKQVHQEEQHKWLSRRNSADKTQLLALYRQRLADMHSMIDGLPRHTWELLEVPKAFRYDYIETLPARERMKFNSRKSWRENVDVDVATGEEKPYEPITGNMNQVATGKLYLKGGSVTAGYEFTKACQHDLDEAPFTVNTGTPDSPSTRTYYLVYLADPPYPREDVDCPPVSVMPFGNLTPIKGGAVAQTWDNAVLLKITDLNKIRHGFLNSKVFILDKNDLKLYADTVKKTCDDSVKPDEYIDYVFDQCRANIIRKIID
jgi:uncharacterized protein